MGYFLFFFTGRLKKRFTFWATIVFHLRMLKFIIHDMASCYTFNWVLKFGHWASLITNYISKKTSTASHAGAHTQYVYGSRDDSVCNAFSECKKIELLNTFTQNASQNFQLPASISNFRITLGPKTHPKTFNSPHWSRLFMTHLTQNHIQIQFKTFNLPQSSRLFVLIFSQKHILKSLKSPRWSRPLMTNLSQNTFRYNPKPPFYIKFLDFSYFGWPKSTLRNLQLASLISTYHRASGQEHFQKPSTRILI